MRSDLLPLSRSTVDRDGVARTDPALFDRLWTDEHSRTVLVSRGLVAIRSDQPGPADPDRAGTRGWGEDGTGHLRLALVAPGDLPVAPEEMFYLGREGRHAYLALVLSESAGDPRDFASPPTDAGAPPVDGARWAALREVGAALPDRDAGLASTALALAAWHARHRRCPRCGALTRSVHSGWARACTADGSLHHPRTDPAIIVAVTDTSDRLLLAHAAPWPQRRYSLVAGYVEPGESLEAAVRREVSEECGITVTDVDYVASQPWPFPASLMLGFRATSAGGDPVPDGEEITAARFVARDELDAAVRSGEVLLPMRTSIARALIEEWFGRMLPGA